MSINHYANVSDVRGGYVEKLCLKHGWIWLRCLLAVLFGRRLVFNGLKCFENTMAICMLLLRRDSVLYLQESEWALNDFKTRYPVRHTMAAYVLGRYKIACVSSVQERYIQDTYGARHTAIVYNTLPFIVREPFQISEVKIMMVGYIMARKGVDLYSKLADYAKSKGDPWQFYWVGGGHDANLYYSPNVRWMGYQAHPRDYYSFIDLFFLASQDEPQGLVCPEAMLHNKRCVAYSGTGNAEVIRGIRGCRVYEAYDEESAYQAICDALAEDLDVDGLREALQNTAGINMFMQRFDALIR